MANPQSSVLSLRGMSVADFDLGHREVAVAEIDDEEVEDFIDLCLGLSEPPRGEVWCLGAPWAGHSYRERLARRRRIGTLAGTQVWPAHVPVAQVALLPQLHHSDLAEDEIVAEATALARRFGLAGLPTPTRETVHPGDLVRAACVRAFLGTPEFVLIADRPLEAMPELALPLAQAIGSIQDRGGAVLWLMDSLSAPAARFVKSDHILRLTARGLVRTGRRP
jgi:phospholipid/cholesterol/gamma-HCH transport system ATP-binding protein